MFSLRLSGRRMRCGGDGGFTLIELLLVLVIIAILIAIAVPSYMGMKSKSADQAAKANLRAAVPDAEAFAADNTGSKTDADKKATTSGYKGMTIKILRKSYDHGLASSLAIVSGKTTATQYCFKDTIGSETWSMLGPATSSDQYYKNAKCK